MGADPDAGVAAKGWLYHPDFPAHWTRRPLYAMADWVNGLAFRDTQFNATGKPIIKIAEIKAGISGQTKFTTHSFDKSAHVTRGDLLFAWSGQPETSIDAFWWLGPDGWLNQHVFKVTPKSELDRTFFFYLLRYLKPHFIGIARNKQTTGLGHVTKRDLENIEAAYPEDEDEQRAIAHILRTLDHKIELDLRMNETLEAIARALYKSWFLDFEAVRAKFEGRDPGLPKALADLSPDSLEDSELGEIPKGWNATPLYDIATYINGAAYTAFQPNDERRGLPIIKIAELKAGVTQQTKFSDAQMPDKYRITKRDILFSWSGNPDTSIDTFVWSNGPGWLNQHIFRVIPTIEHERAFVLSTLKALRPVFAEIARNKQTTGLGHVTVADMKRLFVARPDDRLMQAWNVVVGPLFERVLQNEVDVLALSSLRDTLLPKLISGELRVRNADRLIQGTTSWPI